jgi:hypothetical protein
MMAVASADNQAAPLVNLLIGMVRLPWADVLGSPTAARCIGAFYTAQIINFPERRGGLAKVRAEVEEIKRALARTTPTAGARAVAVGAVGT